MAPEPSADPTFADWLDRVRHELGGGDPLAALSSRPVGGPEVRPLYVAADLPAGALPRPARTERRLRIAVRPRGGTPAELNAAVLDELAGGASALRLPRAAIRDLDTLDEALDEVELEEVSLTLESGGEGLPAAAMLLARLGRRAQGPADLAVTVGADPLAALAAEGVLPRSAERHLEELGALALACDADLPGWRAIEVRGVPYHEAGADDVQELGIVLATSVAYLRTLEAAGLPVERAARQIGWSLAQGRDLLLQISKLRAARRLWERLQAALAVAEPVPLALHAAGSRRTLTRYDRWVNILRGTTQAAAALLGGADEVTVQPFDAGLGEPTELGRRLARNTVHVLEQESALASIEDPARGSYCLECLTDALARGAWEAMRAIEGEGGLVAALGRGALQRRLAERAAERREAIVHRREPITGISEYADLAEDGSSRATAAETAGSTRSDLSGPGEAGDGARAEAVGSPSPSGEAEGGPPVTGSGPPLDRGWLAAAAAAAGEGLDLEALSAWLGDGGPGTRVEALAQLRDAEPFQRLRDAAAQAAERPTLFLANLGPPRRHGTRAPFATQALAAGGIAVVAGEGTGTEDAGAAAVGLTGAFRDSGLRAACLCGDDELYDSLGPAAVAALKAAGASPLWVAAPPGEPADGLLAAGADELLHAGCDLVERLRALHQALGVTSEEDGA